MNIHCHVFFDQIAHVIASFICESFDELTQM